MLFRRTWDITAAIVEWTRAKTQVDERLEPQAGPAPPPELLVLQQKEQQAREGMIRSLPLIE